MPGFFLSFPGTLGCIHARVSLKWEESEFVFLAFSWSLVFLSFPVAGD